MQNQKPSIDPARLAAFIARSRDLGASTRDGSSRIRNLRLDLQDLRARLDPPIHSVNGYEKPSDSKKAALEAQIASLESEIATVEASHEELCDRRGLAGRLANSASDFARTHKQLPSELDN